MGKAVGSEPLGSLYTAGKVRRRREWRGLRDTMYDHFRWLGILGVLLRCRASCGSTSLRSRRPPSISPAKPKAPSTRCALCHSGKSKKPFLHFSFSKIPSLFWQQHSFCGLLSVFPGK